MIHERHKTMNELTHEMTSAYLEINDKMYALADALGLPSEWAAHQLQQLRDSAFKLKNVDLNEA